MIEILNTIDSLVWGPVMIAFLLGTHVFLTIRTGFIQRKLPQAIRMSLKGDSSSKGGHLQPALATALAATIGTGSIVGVATAIIAGGPGAVFWMWIAGIFGIATKYVEVYASIRYRVRDHNGQMLGGVMYVGSARSSARTAPFPGGRSSAPSRSRVSPSLPPSERVRPCRQVRHVRIITSLFPPYPTGRRHRHRDRRSAVVFGGVRHLARVRVARAHHGDRLRARMRGHHGHEPTSSARPSCSSSNAFTPKAAFGGAVGSTCSWRCQFGCARGLFSNESGLGTIYRGRGPRDEKNPAEQAHRHDGHVLVHRRHLPAHGIVLVSTMLNHPTFRLRSSRT